MVSAGLHWSFRMSRQMAPFELTLRARGTQDAPPPPRHAPPRPAATPARRPRDSPGLHALAVVDARAEGHLRWRRGACEASAAGAPPARGPAPGPSSGTERLASASGGTTRAGAAIRPSRAPAAASRRLSSGKLSPQRPRAPRLGRLEPAPPRKHQYLLSNAASSATEGHAGRAVRGRGQRRGGAVRLQRRGKARGGRNERAVCVHALRVDDRWPRAVRR
jgi:hypothetical protein